MPERVLYLEPLRRRLSVEFGGGIIARSDDAVILYEPARYPVACFPIVDIDRSAQRMRPPRRCEHAHAIAPG